MLRKTDSRVGYSKNFLLERGRKQKSNSKLADRNCKVNNEAFGSIFSVSCCYGESLFISLGKGIVSLT